MSHDQLHSTTMTGLIRALDVVAWRLTETAIADRELSELREAVVGISEAMKKEIGQ